eukprot:TRINITY_DN16091_c0_g2_i1.p1 TRINITY_DN16091_c0_g2~~TRINITY_DN16091_c0_g2_i1.p1  ORF type:complete len:131 (-),score=14.36 TRINITY_DN16091_c0_g2_i1:34-426(-)
MVLNFFLFSLQESLVLVFVFILNIGLLSVLYVFAGIRYTRFLDERLNRIINEINTKELHPMGFALVNDSALSIMESKIQLIEYQGSSMHEEFPSSVSQTDHEIGVSTSRENPEALPVSYTHLTLPTIYSV